jgi:hypothetical protein
LRLNEGLEDVARTIGRLSHCTLSERLILHRFD